MFKNVVIFTLIVLIISLFYFIFTGAFCSCSPIWCPIDDEFRSYLT